MSQKIDDNTRKELLRDLASFGVTGHAGHVYVALLPLAEAGIAVLERATGLHRQLIYNALHILEEQGLVMHTIVAGRKRFRAQPPRRLQSLVDEKQRLAQGLMDRLGALAAPGQQQSFEVYQGNAVFVAHEMQSLLAAPEGATLCVLASSWNHYYRIMGRQMEAYERLRVSRKIALRIIGLETQLPTLAAAMDTRKLYAYRVVPGLQNGLMDTSIWPHAISFNFFGDPPIIFELQNEDIARSQQTFFDSLWAMGRM